MRSETPLTQLVEFTDGFPDGDISWILLDGVGSVVNNGVVTPVPNSVSAVVALTAAQNSLADGSDLYEYRELNWSYTVGGLLKTGRRRYRLEAFLPLGVSEEGVRNKLGLESHELNDDAIDLVGAYSRFQADVTAANLDAATGTAALQARDAIEALAGLALLPSLQIKLASKQVSGTDQFQRSSIDWDALRASLELYVGEGYAAVNPTGDPALNFSPLLAVAVRPDPLIGEDV